MNNQDNPNKDEPLPTPPDGISTLAWSPRANHLVSAGWDGKVRVYEVVAQKGASKGVAEHAYNAPVLCSSWYEDGSRLFFGSTDKKALAWDLSTNTASPIAQHDGPIKEIFWMKDFGVLVTASWDRTVKYWDVRQSKEAGCVRMEERVYCMDVKKSFGFVGLANRKVAVINFRQNPSVIYKTLESPLKMQTRSISAFVQEGEPSGFAIGSIEGRVGIHHYEDSLSGKNFAFRCHRQGNNNSEIYAVNSIDFHPRYGTFATAGSDGSFNFWDKDTKQRLKAFSRCATSITSGRFSTNGEFYAYGVSYDWSKGAEFYGQFQQKNFLFVRSVLDDEIKGKKAGIRK